jgi:hypothetical protein
MFNSETQIAINPKANVRPLRIGNEGILIVVIDEFLLDPDSLIEDAVRSPFSTPASPYYPGLNAPISNEYLDVLVANLRPILDRGYNIGSGDLEAHAFFALSTTTAEAMSPLQKIPHYDQFRPNNFALVHYLARNQFSGTGFFRHDATGFETIDLDRRDPYMTVVERQLNEIPARTMGYVSQSTRNYKLIEYVEAKFNRLVLYPSNVLHCAMLDGAQLTDDPKTGRLTANTFINCDKGRR